MSLEPHQRKGLRILQVFLGTMLLFRVCTEIRFAKVLWGPHALGYGSVAPLLGKVGGALDKFLAMEWGATAAVGLLGVAAACLVFGILTRFAAGLALALFFLFEIRLPELYDGGDNVTRLVLGYMLLCLSASAKPRLHTFRVWLHNVGILAIGLQVAILYFTSGFMKLSGDRWTHGTAMYLISQVEWFSLPSLRHVFQNPFVTTLSSYGTMVFQIWFPIAMFSRLKLWWLGVGLMFHLGVAGFMGLIAFSLAMAGLELFFITDRECEMFQSKLSQLTEFLRSRFAEPLYVCLAIRRRNVPDELSKE